MPNQSSRAYQVLRLQGIELVFDCACEPSLAGFPFGLVQLPHEYPKNT